MNSSFKIDGHLWCPSQGFGRRCPPDENTVVRFYMGKFDYLKFIAHMSFINLLNKMRIFNQTLKCPINIFKNDN